MSTNITWASSTTSSNPPQTLSDALALAGDATVSASVHVVSTGQTDFYVGVYGSTDGGATYNLIGSELHALGTTTLSFGPISVGSYDHVKIHNRIGPSGYNQGYFNSSTWTTTSAAAPAELLGGAPWWRDASGSAVGKATELLGGAPWWMEGIETAIGHPAELLQFYTPVPPPTPEPPYVTDINPPPGTVLSQNEPVGFIVSAQETTDTFTNILIVADFPGLGIREVVWDGSNWGPKYTNGTNHQESGTSGGGIPFQGFTILRDGGWPFAPTLIPYAIVDGAENA